MTKIDLDNGRFYLKGKAFPLEANGEENNGHTIGKNFYSNLSLNGIIKEFPLKATGYYKNQKLRSITLTLDEEYLKEQYQPPKDLDFRDYLTPYIDFSKTATEELISELLNSKKRKFDWGKVQVKIDPREPNVYGEIKYH